jgi:transmembrane sensor
MPNWSHIAKYLNGEKLTSEELDHVEKWLLEDQLNEQIVETIKDTPRSIKNNLDFRDSLEEDWIKIMESVSGKKNNNIRLSIILKIAAGLLFFSLAGLALFKSNFILGHSQKFVAQDSIRQIQLADGSTVWLNKNSRLVLDNSFGTSNRTVSLEGEAYFEVRKDPSNKFTIHSGDIQTSVLGTSLNIKCQNNGNVVVTVVDGIVNVSDIKSSQGIILTKDEAAVYWSDRKVTLQGYSDMNSLAWKTGILRFNSIQLKVVCDLLTSHYGKKVLATEDIKDFEITSVIDNLTFDQAIDVVAITLNLHVEEMNDRVLLSKQRD